MGVYMVDELLDKEETFFDRDEKGKIIPSKEFIKGINKHVLLKPLVRGEVLKVLRGLKPSKDDEGKETLVTTDDQDWEAIRYACLEPKFLDEDRDKVKHIYITLISKRIYEISHIFSKDDLGQEDEIEEFIKKKENGIEISSSTSTDTTTLT